MRYSLLLLMLFQVTAAAQFGDLVEVPDPVLDALDKERERSMRTITIRQASLFHARFVECCMDALPKEVTLAYGGPLRTDNGRLKQRIEDQGAGNCLEWDVSSNGLGIFGFWISANKTTQTVSKCKIDNTDVFVNVNFISGNRKVDQPLPELGNCSIESVLMLLEERGKGRGRSSVVPNFRRITLRPCHAVLASGPPECAFMC